MVNLETLRKLEGLHTIETATKAAGISRQATLNLLSRLKKQGYVTTRGGGRRIRLYNITMRKQRKRSLGMFDIINKYSPNFQVAEWYDHQVHGEYGVEDALIDAIKTKSFRMILASLRLFSHIKDWKKLHRLAKQNNLVQEVGALYDVARENFKTKKISKYYKIPAKKTKKYLIRDYEHKNPRYNWIEKKWNVGLPFKKGDLRKGEI